MKSDSTRMRWKSLMSCVQIVLVLICVGLMLVETTESTEVVLVHLHPTFVDFKHHDFTHDQYFSDFLTQEKRKQRRERAKEHLARHMKDVQESVGRFIESSIHEDGELVQIQPLWIQNTLVVRLTQRSNSENATLAKDHLSFFAHQLRWFPGVVDVEYDHAAVQLVGYETAENSEEQNQNVENAQKNIQLLHAPSLWARNVTGKGIVVANIDSGVRYTHEALNETFRGKKHSEDGQVNFDYSFWFTPSTDISKETPDTADLVGHGTHTMGTAVGRSGIGMAPDATWITARAFDIWGAANKSDFLLAAQWVICPTKTDGSDVNCSLGADVVTNSFGVDRTSADYPLWTWMTNVIRTWRAAGVYPVFASGNTNGFLCGSVYYPGSTADTIAVGALIGGSTLWGASGKGPSFTDEYYTDHLQQSALDTLNVQKSPIIKPDFVAPGVGIRSALSTKDSSYTRLTGTSMATPHVAGAIALMLSIDRTRVPSMKKVLKALEDTTVKDLSKPFLVPSTCGNTTYKQYPNNIYGWGMPNVDQAASKLGLQCETTICDEAAKSLVALDDLMTME